MNCTNINLKFLWKVQTVSRILTCEEKGGEKPMEAKLIAKSADDAESHGGNCWVLGYFPDPGNPGGTCFLGLMPDI